MDATIDDTDAHLRSIVSSLYLLIASVHDYQGRETQRTVTTEIKNLIHQLVQLCQVARRLPTYIPLEIIQYVENSRNPDVYTRDFIEVVHKYNQELKGKTEAFAQFRDILGREMGSAIPEIKQDVSQVVAATGGKIG